MSRQSRRGLGSLVEERPPEAFEQLDSALRIVRVRDWSVLAGVFAMLALLGAFSTAYKVPIKVEGRGILLARSGDQGHALKQVTAPAAGRLASILVRAGSEVSTGQVLAEIDQGVLRDQIKTVEADLARLREEDDAITRFDETETASLTETIQRLDRTLRRSLELDEHQLEVYRTIIAGDKNLYSRGMLTNIDVLRSQAASDAVESSIGSNRSKLQELDFKRIEDLTRRRREKLKRTLGLREAETKRGLLVDQLARDSRIVSPYAGTLVDLMIAPHSQVEKGAPVALLRTSPGGDEPREVVVFVRAGDGKKIRPGDPVEIAPDTVKRQEHGFIRGVVRSISEIPATESAMTAELVHKTLADSFSREAGGQALLTIRVEPGLGKPSTTGQAPANRLEWSSRSGSDQRVSSGTLCAASIVVERRPLISLAMPWVKHLIGID
jgi:HlyD family secretion protein